MTHFAILRTDGTTDTISIDGDDPSLFYGGEIAECAAMPRALRPAIERWDWDAGEIVTDLDLLAEQLVARIDRQRAREGAKALTPGESVMLAYNRKGEEVQDLATLDDLEALSSAEIEARFPFLFAEADVRGVPLTAVAEEVAAGRVESESRIAAVEAKARAAKLAVRAADNEAAMRSAASVDWTN